MGNKDEFKNFIEYIINRNKKTNKGTFDDNESSDANSNDYVKRAESGTTAAELNERIQNLEEKSEKIQEISDNIDKISRKQNTLNKQHKELNKKYDELNNMNFKNIEIMSIFFTLFTVISVIANISSNFKELYSSLFFIFSIAFLLIAFLILFHFILHKNLDKSNKKFIWILFVLGLIVCSIFGCLAKNNEEKNRISQNNISVCEDPKSSNMQYKVINNSNEKEVVPQKMFVSSSTINKSTHTKINKK